MEYFQSPFGSYESSMPFFETTDVNNFDDLITLDVHMIPDTSDKFSGDSLLGDTPPTVEPPRVLLITKKGTILGISSTEKDCQSQLPTYTLRLADAQEPSSKPIEIVPPPSLPVLPSPVTNLMTTPPEQRCVVAPPRLIAMSGQPKLDIDPKLLKVRAPVLKTVKKPVPEELKDAAYYEMRKKNMLSARKCRDKKRQVNEERVELIRKLHAENLALKAEIEKLEKELTASRQLIEDYKRLKTIVDKMFPN